MHHANQMFLQEPTSRLIQKVFERVQLRMPEITEPSTAEPFDPHDY